jgi:O-antigen/teichoic acid export membrane protein
MNQISTVVSVLTSLAITPFIVERVGLEAYGLWSVVLAILQYAQIANGSFPTVTVRLVARALERDDPIELRATVATTMVSLVVVAAMMTLAGLSIPRLLPSSVTSGLPHGWQAAVGWGGLSLALTTLSGGLAGVPRGGHRWDLDAMVLSTSQILGCVVTVPILLNGGRLPALGLIAAITSGTAFVGYLSVAIWMNALGGAGFRPKRSIFRELRQQGIALQIVGLVGATNAQADRLMLLPFASLSFIGAYALGSRIAVTLRGLPLSAFGPLLARFSAAESVGGLAALAALYQRALRVVADYAFPILLALYFAAYPAVLAWLGASYRISAAGAVLLGVGYAVNILTGPGTSAAIASGNAELDRDYNLLGLALNVVLTVGLGIAFGAWGVVAATTLGLVLSSGWLLHRVDSLLHAETVRDVLARNSFVVTTLGVVLLGAVTVVGTCVLAPSGRLENLAIATASGLIATMWVMRDIVSSLRDGVSISRLKEKLLSVA